MNITLRAATADDYDFLERVFFTTQRWIIERLFGWRGDDFERRRLHENHDFGDAQVIVADGREVGWLIVDRRSACLEIDGIYLLPEHQRKGIGSKLIAGIIADAERRRLPLRLSVAKINPARSLYARLGFRTVSESEFKLFMERA